MVGAGSSYRAEGRPGQGAGRNSWREGGRGQGVARGRREGRRACERSGARRRWETAAPLPPAIERSGAGEGEAALEEPRSPVTRTSGVTGGQGHVRKGPGRVGLVGFLFFETLTHGLSKKVWMEGVGPGLGAEQVWPGSHGRELFSFLFLRNRNRHRTWWDQVKRRWEPVPSPSATRKGDIETERERRSRVGPWERWVGAERVSVFFFSFF